MMSHRIFDASAAGWAAASGTIAALTNAAEGMAAVVPGGEYLGELGALSAVLLFLWKVGERVGKTVIEQGSKGGARLLKFLEDKDEKDRKALKEFGAGLEASVNHLAASIESSAAEQRAGFMNLSQQIQQAQAATPASKNPRRRAARQEKGA